MNVSHFKRLFPAPALARLGITFGVFFMALTFMPVERAAAFETISLATDPLTVKECSDCHPAYSPRYLRAYAWQKIMGDLANHFGENATLDEQTRIKIEEYLVYNASRPRKIGLRITNKKWFKREHGRKRVMALVKKKAIHLTNCTACHQERISAKNTLDRRPK